MTVPPIVTIDAQGKLFSSKIFIRAANHKNKIFDTVVLSNQVSETYLKFDPATIPPVETFCLISFSKIV
jgi:hypothetical protein